MCERECESVSVSVSVSVCVCVCVCVCECVCVSVCVCLTLSCSRAPSVSNELALLNRPCQQNTKSHTAIKHTAKPPDLRY